ncbi:MAG: SirB1 family protein [Leptolyngbyaceae bacterium]|nr:SirB1 family protein [Leptolyngbyaceae bacterium]
MDFSFARQQFYHEVNQPDEHIDLAKAALCIALEEYPDIDVEAYLNALETMAEDVRDRLPVESYPLRIIRVLNDYLFSDLAFSGNAAHYYDPDNSYLNRVIDRRSGIPITLSLVYLEIAKRIDFPMVGVGMPGHFLVRPDQDELEICVDPFHQGDILFVQDCEERIETLFNGNVAFQPEFLAPVSNKQFLARMLSNLKMIYLNQGRMRNVLAAIDRILLLFPNTPYEQRDRGLIYYQVGRWVEARQDLENYLLHLPQARDADLVKKLLTRIQTGSQSGSS